jgi:hypothetical protein
MFLHISYIFLMYIKRVGGGIGGGIGGIILTNPYCLWPMTTPLTVPVSPYIYLNNGRFDSRPV